MVDAFKDMARGLESPATSITNITPDNNTDLPLASRALNVAGAGTVQITTIDNNTATIFVAAGIAFPVRAKRIWQTGTTATGIVALS